MKLQKLKFADIDLADPFFNSLKQDYSEFSAWFEGKSDKVAYVFHNDGGSLEAFLYLKAETGPIVDIDPPLDSKNRLKIGTFKINPHGTKLGERFIKKVFDHAIETNAEEIYVTVFPKHDGLVKLFKKYGFERSCVKKSANGIEDVYIRRLEGFGSTVLTRYPFVRTRDQRVFLLSIYPDYHTRLFPDSILNNESYDVVQDVSHTNSIHKVYLCAMPGVDQLVPGDVLLIYRTSDQKGPAHYRSVVTSVCVLEEYRNINSFGSIEEFLNYCNPYSVFTDAELRQFWAQKRYPHIIRFTYNLALAKRLTRGKLIENLGFDATIRWSFFQISKSQLIDVLRAGGVNESLVVD